MQPIQHRLQPVRGAIQIERIGSAGVQMDLAIQIGLELRPLLQSVRDVVVTAPGSRHAA